MSSSVCTCIHEWYQLGLRVVLPDPECKATHKAKA